jgi:hypothetical protein
MEKSDKDYFEQYASFSIAYILEFEESSFSCRDCPDLHNDKYGYGIEVVQAITEHDGRTRSLIREYYGKGLSGEKIIKKVAEKNKKEKFKGEVFSIDNIGVISGEKGLYNSSKHKMLIIDKIKEKSDRFKKYKHFNKNGLYCFAHTGMINSDDCVDILLA